MSARESTDAGLMASRLLARAVRPHPVYDVEKLQANYTAELASEDLALSESTVREHEELLTQEDQA